MQKVYKIEIECPPVIHVESDMKGRRPGRSHSGLQDESDTDGVQGRTDAGAFVPVL